MIYNQFTVFPKTPGNFSMFIFDTRTEENWHYFNLLQIPLWTNNKILGMHVFVFSNYVLSQKLNLFSPCHNDNDNHNKPPNS